MAFKLGMKSWGLYLNWTADKERLSISVHPREYSAALKDTLDL